MRVCARPRAAFIGAALIVALVFVAIGEAACARSEPPPSGPPSPPLPLRVVGHVDLPRDSSRFDFASLDVARGPLFVAHLGASQVVEVDLRIHQVVRVIPAVAQVHGVLVVPSMPPGLCHRDR